MSKFVPLAELKTAKAEVEIAAPSITPEAKAPAKIDKLSLEQRLALMQMNDRGFVQAVYRGLREEIQIPPFTTSTFAELRELGLAKRPDGERYHRLTIQGRIASDLIAMREQKERQIHRGYYGGSEGSQQSVFCTCGWSCAVSRGHNAQGKAMVAITTHLRAIEAVTKLAKSLHPQFTKT